MGLFGKKEVVDSDEILADSVNMACHEIEHIMKTVGNARDNSRMLVEKINEKEKQLRDHRSRLVKTINFCNKIIGDDNP